MENLHVGLIMDGNGRWAKQRHLPRTVGHLQGLKSLKKVVLAAIKYNVKYLTLYCFSTENWKRSPDEVSYLMNLFNEKIYGELPFYNEHSIKVLTIGDISQIPEDAKESLLKVVDATKDNSKIIVQLAINYGGQAEICESVNRAIKAGVTTITPEVIRSYMNNPSVPPVDLIARSAGEQRLSNFLLFDSAYAELVFIDKLWPDWSEEEVKYILDEYTSRDRRFGGVK